MKSLTVLGRRWFDRRNGNTYHSATIVIDGQKICYIPFCYGYDGAYIDTAAQWLESNGYLSLERYANGGREALWGWCSRNGVLFYKNATDVSRRKDL